MTDARSQLEDLLSGTTGSLTEVLRRFDNTEAFPDDDIVLVGSGRLANVVLQGLKRLGIAPLALADTDQSLWNTSIEGVNVLSEEEAARRYGQKAVFVVALWSAWGEERLSGIKDRLQGMNCTRVVSVIHLFWKYPEAFLPFFCIDLPERVLEHSEEIRATFDLWADEPSRRQFIAELRWRLLLDFSMLEGITPFEQYFPEDLFELSGNEVFVDGGAYDGDTLRSFLQRRGDRFRQVVAIEADPHNFQRLEEYVASVNGTSAGRIAIHQVAMGSRNGIVAFDDAGTRLSSVSQDGAAQVSAAPLDDLLQNQAPTYIKMDIEGSEYEALKGARNIIEQYRPILGICVYHRPDDLWRVPLYIAGISGDYRLFLRPHKLVCWDLLCYAVPPERLISR
jgi:FkbM family methyltransferase